MTENIKCIYCTKEKPKSEEFWNREHVIPEAFGKFKNNFVLHYLVCSKCNQDFGDEIDLILARESYEGKVLRYLSGIKNTKEFKEFKKGKSNTISIIEGINKGALAELVPNKGRLDLIPKPQLLVKIGNQYKPFLINDIPDISYFHEKGIDLENPKTFKILGDFNAVIKIMKEKGFNINIEGEYLPEENHAEAEYTWKIENSFRGIAKIAFNYLAYWKGREYALKPEFDIIREFIVSGKKPEYPLVKVTNDSIIKNPEYIEKRPIGHVITINMASNKVSMMASVSLLNQITYNILLALFIEEKKENIPNRGLLTNDKTSDKFFH